jgi:hypothetical protein
MAANVTVEVTADGEGSHIARRRTALLAQSAEERAHAGAVGGPGGSTCTGPGTIAAAWSAIWR